MDSKSIAATVFNGVQLTSAEEMKDAFTTGTLPEFHFNKAIYDHVVYNGFGKAQPETEIIYGPSIKDWPKMEALTDNLLLEVASVIRDEVTTTDELIPSGETASYRSNPYKISEFTLLRKDPSYVARPRPYSSTKRHGLSGDKATAAKFYAGTGKSGRTGGTGAGQPAEDHWHWQRALRQTAWGRFCQRICSLLPESPGSLANICIEYATKRYRSNCVELGIAALTNPDRKSNLTPVT